MIGALLVAAAIAAPLAAASIVAPTSPVISADGQCGDGYYWSKTVGACVPGEATGPTPGATYQCADGTYSFSKASRGACSRHGGIDHAL
jgi:hypothetical protein